MKPIAIFYHCLFMVGDPPVLSPLAFSIVQDQMNLASDLISNASLFMAGVNGGEESLGLASLCFPPDAKTVMHGLQCKNECRTIRMIEEWLPGHEDWNVLYFHSKGATKPAGDSFSETWRKCMMKHCITNWRQCVSDLENGYESVGVHWMTGNQTPPGQSIWAGTFMWAKASFLITLPSIMLRDRIKVSGLDSMESRFEAEVWIGNGPRLPIIKDYHPNWNPSRIATCIQ